MQSFAPAPPFLKSPRERVHNHNFVVVNQVVHVPFVQIHRFQCRVQHPHQDQMLMLVCESVCMKNAPSMQVRLHRLKSLLRKDAAFFLFIHKHITGTVRGALALQQQGKTPCDGQQRFIRLAHS